VQNRAPGLRDELHLRIKTDPGAEQQQLGQAATRCAAVGHVALSGHRDH